VELSAPSSVEPRARPDGSLDPTVGTLGRVITTVSSQSDRIRRTGALALGLLPDGRLVAAGSYEHDFAFTPHLPDDRPDTSFGGECAWEVEPARLLP
jgi:hypothetical protein